MNASAAGPPQQAGTLEDLNVLRDALERHVKRSEITPHGVLADGDAHRRFATVQARILCALAEVIEP